MRKLAVPLITCLAFAILIGSVAYVVSAEAPDQMTSPALKPEPMVLSPETSTEPTPTTLSTATPTPTLFPAATLAQSIELEPATNSIAVHYGEQPPYALTAAGYDRVQLVNNGTANDPTWQQLVSFLIADKTDEKDYVTGSFMCGAFAEVLHNNAEAAGIRAAWVTVVFDGRGEGHAIDAFYTKDKGLVYIDCSGKTPQNNTQSVGMDSISPGGLRVYSEVSSWDKVAYVAVGKELGLVSIYAASCPQYVCYADYEQRKASFEASLDDYKQRAQNYNSEVLALNEWVAGRVFIEGTSDSARAHQWSEELGQERDNLTTLAATLDEEGKSLGAFWQTLGIVKKIDMYW